MSESSQPIINQPEGAAPEPADLPAAVTHQTASQLSAPKEEDASSAEEMTKSIEDLPIRITGGHHIGLKTAIGAVLGVIAAIYSVTKFVEISPLEKQLVGTTNALVLAQSQTQSLSTDLDQLRQKYAEIMKTNANLTLTFPQDGASLIGSQITFEWEFREGENVSGYVLELQDLSTPGTKQVLMEVARPETKRMHYNLGPITSHEYIWRVRPGTLVRGILAPQGAWSNSHRFTAFSSVSERISRTGTVLVATTPTSYDAFVAKDGNGNYVGFEIELMRWIVDKISVQQKRTVPLVAQVVEVPWSRLFQALQQGEVDVAMRSICKSLSREKQYSNLVFSKGYLHTHEILIHREDRGNFPQSLKGRKVGVKTSSMNERAALFLAPLFQFEVDSSYTNYGDLYKGLREGRISYALVDSNLASSFVPSEFFQFGPFLDKPLKPFFQQELGYDSEDYAVAIHDESREKTLVNLIDRVLELPETVAYIDNLKRKYGLP